MDLKDKVPLVTGGTIGLGAAIALELRGAVRMWPSPLATWERPPTRRENRFPLLAAAAWRLRPISPAPTTVPRPLRKRLPNWDELTCWFIMPAVPRPGRSTKSRRSSGSRR